jgi:hypothetical protein
MYKSLMQWLQQNRPDIEWIKGPDHYGLYQWDETLPNQSEIQPLIDQYDPQDPLTEPQVLLNDIERFTKRAQVKNQIIAEMAAENMQRVRSGLWQVSDLVSLTQDLELKSVLDDVNSLSFELASQKVGQLTNALITQDIKDEWLVKLAAHFYN